ncbi:MAG: beta/gamma crystallin-related protein [Pseudomonadota bacterium]
MQLYVFGRDAVLAAALLLSAGAVLAESDHPNAEIILYAESNERGASYGTSGEHGNLAGSGFDNRARSILVRAGVWQLCSAPNFQGSCRNYDPGRHELNSQLSGQVSSLRKGGPINSDHHHRRLTGEDVVLYSGDYGAGQAYGTTRNLPSLIAVGFNDVPRSLDVRSGTWQLCRDLDYAGPCETFGPGLHELGGLLYRQGSSLRRIHVGGGGSGGHHHSGDLDGSASVVLYSGRDGTGARYASNGKQPDLRKDGFNDRAQSVRVRHGTWRFCENINYSGSCHEFAVGLHNLGNALDRKLSSFEMVSQAVHHDHPQHDDFKVVLYEGRDGRGHSISLYDQHVDLNHDGFANRARSVRVNGGTWLLCSRPHYQGVCRTFHRGLHDLGPGLGGHVASLREE